MRPVFAGLFIVGLGLGACSGSHEPVHERAHQAAPPQAAELDVPNLLPLSIDELSQRVGPLLPVPANFQDPTLTPLQQRQETPDSMCLFRYRGLAMVVAYSYSTRRVNNLLLLGSNEDALMSRAKLKLGATEYLVLPVFEARRSTKLLGLRVLSTHLNQ
ncbi:hypothetical protein [Hymenobacter rubidus]|uniref:hypothetical protein n=1 Tax=Hymenobacter rubidus TaxID=1441626 RepID=UPI00191FC763|nr:hypothetical protein [Hymenobacter rubidus]